MADIAGAIRRRPALKTRSDTIPYLGEPGASTRAAAHFFLPSSARRWQLFGSSLMFMGVKPSRDATLRFAFIVGVMIGAGTCASRRTSGPPPWAATPQAQVPGPGRSAPPPPVTPELDPEENERRFGIAEGRARREYLQQNAASTSGGAANASQAVVPMPQGAPVPAMPSPSPDGGARDAGRRPR